MAEEWELQALKDAFPRAGEDYFLRPQGAGPLQVIYSSKTGHEFVKLKCQFWAYLPVNRKLPEFTRTTPLMVLQVEVYPGCIAELAGKWNAEMVYHMRAQKDGQKVFLHLLKSYPAPLAGWDAPAPTPQPPAPAGPISPPAASPAAAPPAVGGAAETAPVCPECGQKATRFHEMWVHCGREVGL